MKIYSSIVSGIFAALAGAFGKFAFQDFQMAESSYITEILYKGISALIMLVLNSLMIKYFMQSLKDLGASKASVVNFACNYLSSALCGYLLFSEFLSAT